MLVPEANSNAIRPALVLVAMVALSVMFAAVVLLLTVAVMTMTMPVAIFYLGGTDREQFSRQISALVHAPLDFHHLYRLP